MFAISINWPLVILLTIALLGLVVFGLTQALRRTKPIAQTESPEYVSAFRALAEQLDALGYYRFVPTDVARECKNEVERTCYPWGWEKSARDFPSDAEELAEGGAGEFIRSLRPTLKKLGVKVESVRDESRSVEESTYVECQVVIDGQSSLIVSPYDEQLGDELWALAAARTFGVVNRLLERAGIEDRLYAIEGGNDLRGVFLTEAMVKAVEESNLLGREELPYRVDLQYGEDARPE